MTRTLTPPPDVYAPREPATRNATASISVRRLREDEYRDWDLAVSRSAQRSPFLRSAWLSALGRYQRTSIALMGCFHQSELVGGLCGIETKTARGTRWELIDLSPCTGVWLSDGPATLAHRAQRQAHRVMDALRDALVHDAVAVRIDCHPASPDLRPFLWNGWQSSVRYTLVTDLHGDFERRLDPDVRRRVTRSLGLAHEFDDALAPEAFVPIWEKTLERQGVALPIAPADLIPLLHELTAAGSCRIHGMRAIDGRVLAGNVVIESDGEAAYWLAGHDTDASDALGANQHCAVQTLRHAAARGKRRFDWVGANTPTVAAYKQAFGGTLVPYVRLSWSRAADVSAAGAGSSRSRRSSWRNWLRDCPLWQRRESRG